MQFLRGPEPVRGAGQWRCRGILERTAQRAGTTRSIDLPTSQRVLFLPALTPPSPRMRSSPPGRAGLGSRGPRRPQPGRRRVATRRSSGARRQPGSRGGAAPPRAGRHRAAGPRAPSPGAPGAPRPLMSHQAPPAHTEGPGCGASSPCIPVPVPIPTRAPPLQAPPGRLARRARSGVGGGGGGRRRGLLSGGWRSQRAVGRGAGAAGVSCWSEACPSRQAPCGAGERRLHGAGGGGGGGGGRQQQRAARRPLHPPP